MLKKIAVLVVLVAVSFSLIGSYAYAQDDNSFIVGFFNWLGSIGSSISSVFFLSHESAVEPLATDVTTSAPSQPYLSSIEFPEESSTIPDSQQTISYSRAGTVSSSRIRNDIKADLLGTKTPGGLKPEVRKALNAMQRAAEKDGIKLGATSGYVSLDSQIKSWNRLFQQYYRGYYSDTQDKAAAEKKAADVLSYSLDVPGMSRLHWGTEIFVNSIVFDGSGFFCISRSPEDEADTGDCGLRTYEWLRNNAWKFGFCQPYDKSRPGKVSRPLQWSYKPVALLLSIHYKVAVNSNDLKGRGIAGEGSILQNFGRYRRDFEDKINEDCLTFDQKLPKSSITPDVVFVPINFDESEKDAVYKFAIEQLNFFKNAIPNACSQYLNSFAIISVNACNDESVAYSGDEQGSAYACGNRMYAARKCAIRNGYITTKRIIGIYKDKENKIGVGGCGDLPGRVSVALFGKAPDVAIAHELGHNFGLGHVTGPSSYCNNPPDACKTTYPNYNDCTASWWERSSDIMSYCDLPNKYGKAAASYINQQCSNYISGNNNQRVAAIDATIHKTGEVEIGSVHIGYGEPDMDAPGNLVVTAVSGDDTLSSTTFATNFDMHADGIDENGNLVYLPVSLDSRPETIILPYSPAITGVNINSEGQGIIASADFSQLAQEGRLFFDSESGPKPIVSGQYAVLAIGISPEKIAYMDLIEDENGDPVYVIKGVKGDESGLPGLDTATSEKEFLASVSAANGQVLAVNFIDSDKQEGDNESIA